MIGAGVSKKSERIDLRINADGRAATNTIIRAELVAILVALQEMKDMQSHKIISTDSQASMLMIRNICTNLASMPRTSTKQFCTKSSYSCSTEQQQGVRPCF